MADKPFDLLGLAQETVSGDGIADVADGQADDLWGKATSDAERQKVLILGDEQKVILSRIGSQGFIGGTAQRKGPDVR